jgi:hypothetical protein
MKVARSMVIGTVILWTLHGIPYLVYYDLIPSRVNGQYSCAIKNTIFDKYINIGFNPVVLSGLPMAIMILFGILAYRNVQQIAYRTVPMVRRELDKQLTRMVLVQVFFDIFSVTPQIIFSILSLIVGTQTDLVIFVSKIKAISYFFYFSVGILFY